MASNSPGIYSSSQHVTDTQDHLVLSELLPDMSTQGRYNMDIGIQRDNLFVGRDSGYYVSTSDGASTCSSSTAETWELEGAALLVLESKSLRSFTTNDEYLLAMKEDLADWFSSLYQNYDITASNLFQVLETGVLLCKHANKVQEVARQSREMGEALEMRSYFIRAVPEGNVAYREGVKPETFQARDNVSNFISWTRDLGIPQVLSFETDDLVLRKNEKSVILSLLEVARVGAKLGMLAPTLVQMEQEIDAELAGEDPPPQRQIITCDLRSLDERVRDLIGRCTCPIQFPMIKVGDGKYKIGDTKNLIFVRILRNHVMVRVGGGWDTLENYLNKHDPCQCNYRGHRSGTPKDAHKMAASQQRRSSIPNNVTLGATLAAPTFQKRGTAPATMPRNRSASPQTSSRGSSPTTSVITSYIPAPPNPGEATVKGNHITPGQNQQEVATAAWPHPFPNLTNNSSSSQPMRASSPNFSHIKASSPFRAAQNKSPTTFSSRTSPNSAQSKGQDPPQGIKTSTPKMETVRSLNRSSFEEHAGQDPETELSPLDMEQGFELGAPAGLENINELTLAEFKPHGSTARHLSKEEKHNLLKHQDGVAIAQSKTNPSATSNRNSLKTTTHSAKELQSQVSSGGVGSRVKSGEAARRNSLSQFSEKDKNGSASSMGASRQRAQTVLHSDAARTPVSHPKRSTAASTAKSSTSNSGSRQKMSDGPKRTTDKGNKLNTSPLPGFLTADTPADVTSHISDWLQSTNDVVLADVGSSEVTPPTRSKITAAAFNNIPLKETIAKDNQTVVSETVDSPQVQAPTSTIRERPATMSRIPKPRYSSQASTPKTPSTVSITSPKISNDLSSPQQMKSLNCYPAGSSIAAAKNFPSSSKLISATSPGESPPSPDSSRICNEGIDPGTVHAHAGDVSDKSITPGSDNTSCGNNDYYTNIKARTVGSDPETADPHEQLYVTSDPVSPSGTQNANMAESYQRRSSLDFTLQTSTLTQPLLIHRSSSVSTLESQQQMMIINEITFSDDEEINELIRRSSVTEKTTDVNINSSAVPNRKLVHRKAKGNEEVMMIRRDGTGHHVVQLAKKNEFKNDSTPKSRAVVRHTNSRTGSKDSSSSAKANSGNISQTADPKTFRQTKSSEGSAKSKSKNKLLPQSKQDKDFGNEALATDLSPRPLEEIQAILTETKNGFHHADDDPMHSPREDLEMFKKMEKLFKEYRQIEKASVDGTPGKESRRVHSEKSDNSSSAPAAIGES